MTRGALAPFVFTNKKAPDFSEASFTKTITICCSLIAGTGKGMNPESIISKFISSHHDELRTMAGRIAGKRQLADELLQESVLAVLETGNKSTILEAISEGHGTFYFARTMRNLVTNTNARFHKREKGYEKRKSDFDFQKLYICTDDNEEERRRVLDQIDIIVAGERYYYRELWKLYYEEQYNMTRLSRETGISRRALYNSIAKLTDQVITQLTDAGLLKEISHHTRTGKPTT